MEDMSDKTERDLANANMFLDTLKGLLNSDPSLANFFCENMRIFTENIFNYISEQNNKQFTRDAKKLYKKYGVKKDREIMFGASYENPEPSISECIAKSLLLLMVQENTDSFEVFVNKEVLKKLTNGSQFVEVRIHGCPIKVFPNDWEVDGLTDDHFIIRQKV